MEIILALHPIVVGVMDFIIIALPALFTLMAISGMIWGKPYENDNDLAIALTFGMLTIVMILI